MLQIKSETSETKLTISIPTFNRPQKIQTQVRLLLPQINENVFLVVYDNNSETPVKELFTEEELSKFTVIRNRVNIGADANIARGFENCLTQWLWTVSDDDFVKSDAVEIAFAQIKENPEAVFINFWSDPCFKTIGFKELSFKFSNPRVFSNSFTMANCIYDMSKLKDSLQVYYNNLSSMVGPIILVLKYVQSHDGAICIFTDKTLVNHWNTEVGWNYGVYIGRTVLFTLAFNEGNNRLYNRTLFLGYHKINYGLVRMNRKESQISYFQRWRAYLQTIKNQGFINAILYSPIDLISVFLYLIMPKRALSWLTRAMKIF